MSAARMTSLSGNELFCMSLKGLHPKGVVVGNSVHSLGVLGVLGGLRSAFSGTIGGEVTAVTEHP